MVGNSLVWFMSRFCSPLWIAVLLIQMCECCVLLSPLHVLCSLVFLIKPVGSGMTVTFWTIWSISGEKYTKEKWAILKPAAQTSFSSDRMSKGWVIFVLQLYSDPSWQHTVFAAHEYFVLVWLCLFIQQLTYQSGWISLLFQALYCKQLWLKYSVGNARYCAPCNVCGKFYPRICSHLAHFVMC